MQGDPADHSADSIVRARASLARIASALGLPETALMHSTEANAELEECCELLRIWHSLDGTTGRQEVLAIARTVALRG